MPLNPTLQTYKLFRQNLRVPVNELMNQLIDKKYSCENCQGVCCTFVYNSMKIDSLEALDILIFLFENNRLNENTLTHIENNISSYGLDRPEISTGTKILIRRKYTCPFYKDQVHGCSLSRESKPLGCLAFNPVEENAKGENSCSSYKQVLIDSDKNNLLNTECESWLFSQQLYFEDKLPIPVALKHLWQAFLKTIA